MKQREIKFRVWNPIQEMMLRAGRAYWCDGGVLAENQTGNEDGEVLMQYTGLKDKNGKEIFEGDVVIGYMWCMYGDYQKKGYPKGCRYYLQVGWSDGKNWDCGPYLKQIKVHPDDEKYDANKSYRLCGYSLQEDRETHLKDGELVWVGKNNSLEIIGNIYENPELLT